MTADADGGKLGRDWWRTSIIEMSPGVIRFRGYPIEDLIGRASFAQMIWLLTRGELPTQAQAALLDAALMAGVDHGPQAPSIAIARMAATCGVGLNNAMASGLNVLGDVHGGAGEQAVALFESIAARAPATSLAARAQADSLAGRAQSTSVAARAQPSPSAAARGREAEEAASTQELSDLIRSTLDTFIATHGKFIPGYGHRFHPVDPRAAPLLALVDAAATRGEVSGRYATLARAIEDELAVRKGKRIPLNIDGATAVIYAELGFPAPLARGLFCLSRSVGILAHAWEQTQQGGRNKGPLPRQWTPTYDGEPKRDVPKA